MADPGLKVVVGCAVAAGLLIALHFTRDSEQEVATPKARNSRAESQALAEEGAARDRAKWDEWKAKFQVEAGDTKQERDEKGLARTMQALRAQPVEIVDRPDSRSSGVQIQQPSDIQQVLAGGGSYSGPLPPELEKDSGGNE